MSCTASLADAKEIKQLYRIENVSMKRAARITANEEERVRQGQETQTTMQLGELAGNCQMTLAEIVDDRGLLLELQCGPAATVWRMNFGWIAGNRAQPVHRARVSSSCCSGPCFSHLRIRVHGFVRPRPN